MYRQDGYSEIFTFKYGGQCAAVQNINIEVKASDRFYITWDPIPNSSFITSHYTIAYRKYTTSRSWEWHEIETFSPYLNLVNLEGNTEYEIKVGGVCADGSVAYTSPLVKRTLPDGQIAGITCGVAPVIDLSNKTLIAKLQVNDVVMANDFPVVLTKVQGTPEGWSGEGWTKMKWLGDIKLRLVYTGIKVNTDMRLIDGFFETTYNPAEPNVVSMDEFIEDVVGIIEDIAELIKGTDKLTELLQKPQENKEEIEQWVAVYEPKLNALIDEASIPAEQKAALKQEIADMLKQTLTASASNTSEEAIAAAKKVSERLSTIKEVVTEASIQLPETEPAFVIKTEAEALWITPAGTPLRLPLGTKLRHYKVDRTHWWPKGAIMGFELPDGKHYAAKYTYSGKFYGYYDTVYFNDKSKRYEDNTAYSSLQSLASYLLYYEDADSCGYKVYTTQVTYKSLENCTALNKKESNDIKTVDQQGSLLKTISSGQFVCREASGLNYYVQQNKLAEWLNKKGIGNAEIYLGDCVTGKVTKISASGNEPSSLTNEQAKAKVLNKDFTGDFAIYGCIGKDGRWQIESNFGKNALRPSHPKLQDKSAIEAEIKKQAEEEVTERNNRPGGPNTNEEKYAAGEDGEFYKQGMGIIEAVAAIYDFGKEIVNEARMPEQVWDNNKEKYKDYYFHMPGLLAGGTDQVIDEVTSGVQFVKLGYEVVRYPKQTFNGLWNAVKKIKPSDIRQLIITDEAIANYKKGGTVAKHQGGKDGVRVAMAVFTVWKAAGKSSKEILEKGGDEIDDIVSKTSLDDAVKKNIDELLDAADADKMIKDVYEDAAKKEFLESASEELKDIAQKQGRKSKWDEVLARFKRGNDFNKKRALDYDFNEVTIEHPTLKNANGTPKRFRVDSYNEGTDIVSRKATDLTDIQQATFEGYLKELVSKYPEGAKIITPGSAPSINGKYLKGNFKLEIPASNSSFSGLNQYRQIASNFNHNGKTFNIEIVLKPE